MDENEFKKLVARAEAGSVLVGIDRTIARKFFTELSFAELHEKTGESLYVEKGAVFALFVSGPLLLLASIALAPFAIGWWSLLAVPLSLAAYVFVWSLSSLGAAGATTLAFVFASAIVALLAGWFPTLHLSWYVVLVTAACLSARLVYLTATRFLRALVLRNRRAFELLAPTIQLRETASAERVNDFETPGWMNLVSKD